MYAYILMGCNMKRGFGVSGYLVADKLDFKPGGRRDVKSEAYLGG